MQNLSVFNLCFFWFSVPKLFFLTFEKCCDHLRQISEIIFIHLFMDNVRQLSFQEHSYIELLLEILCFIIITKCCAELYREKWKLTE